MKERGNKKLRLLDRYLGIPLIFCLGLFRKKQKKPKIIQSIALLKTSGIGDTVILSAIVRDLKAALPNREITLFTGKLNYEMGKLIKGCHVVSLPISKPFAAIQMVRQKQFDLWVDFGPWSRINALFTFFSLSRYKLGFKTAGQYRHYIYDQFVNHSKELHEINNYRALIKAIGVQKHGFPHIDIEKQVPKKRRVALHLFPGGSRAELKMWPLENWMDLIDRLLNDGYEIVLTGGKNDRLDIDKPGILNKAGKLSLKETATYLTTCEHVISIDTGIMHLAAAIGCHVISLHGPTSEKRWGAVGENVTVIKPTYEYTPCINFGYESTCKTNTCMKSITVDRVINAIKGRDESMYFSRGKRDKTLALLASELP